MLIFIIYSTLEAECGPVWALQLKNEVLISGHQDKVVKKQNKASTRGAAQGIFDSEKE